MLRQPSKEEISREDEKITEWFFNEAKKRGIKYYEKCPEYYLEQLKKPLTQEAYIKNPVVNMPPYGCSHKLPPPKFDDPWLKSDQGNSIIVAYCDRLRKNCHDKDCADCSQRHMYVQETDLLRGYIEQLIMQENKARYAELLKQYGDMAL